jgi:type IV secretory pathway TrbF-like protein
VYNCCDQCGNTSDVSSSASTTVSPTKEALPMRTRAVAIFAVVFSIGLSCATASHQEYQSSVLDGWASRLSIPVDESHSNRQDEKVAGSSRVNVESVSPSLVLSKYAVSKAYHWLFEEAEEILKAVVEEQEIEKPVWKDTAPR